MTKAVGVGLLGFGTVGSGVVEIIQRHQNELQHKVGCPVEVKKILVRDVNKQRKVEVNRSILTEVASDVIYDPEVDIIVEVMGGIEDTKLQLIEALNQKKHVVTANKDLMALHGAELLKVAAENQCDLFYEASVAGGIPILKGLSDGLSADRITKMMGIVNGTTNYILTKMTQEGSSYEEVLSQAQELGFAESDPTADVEGLDAARKMAILATLGFSVKVQLDDVSVRGISSVSDADLHYSHQLGYTMKLIGLAQRDEDRIEVSVQPTLLPHHHPLSSVHNEYNAVYVYGEAVGETMFYGPGAGSLPTATAAMSDLVQVIRNMRLGVNGKTVQEPLHERVLKEDKEIESQYFIRLKVVDRAGTFSTITSLFAEYEVSFEKLLQLPIEGEEAAEVIIITHKTNKENYQLLINRLNELAVVHSLESSYRVEGGQ
ncbi:homoserine dehydrogenase [Alkalihalobacillus alcalophilus ATCC 27647 = CGMCC 1.3604]|uniref:Homoserine dehydrogenase n=1 Tax=Alkalihalobacillus alcalophilus ATCC 27647 = CGMCC 1.3604 TaxID=1218173 RepID=A0A094WIT7_ALKAL|nr:homoserine dehydrogenase [Alkalihalobacillus alcalophilus]KGA95853.1 homoserine dehydrogenase [Alkalihalobacillus alcalophilus ATCC 27647 = CGMCC 1.3604]MED1563438.1 homoserine dehydrogenase [Alkalihalobacillus alcalophilus]THG89309.1 homoserine dehydrogenase [Alkalihalobacillus alcalophilus ATCC 27647 = CGMCC 1.3604]